MKNYESCFIVQFSENKTDNVKHTSSHSLHLVKEEQVNKRFQQNYATEKL